MRLYSVILKIPDAFEHIVRFYGRQFNERPLLVDLTSGKRKMYEMLEDYNQIDFLFLDVDPSVDPSLIADARFCPLREGCTNIVVVDLPYPARLMSWSKHLYKTVSINTYRNLARKIAKEARRILKEDGILVWKCIDVFLKREQRLLPIHMLVIKWVREAGLRLWDIVLGIEMKATTRTYRRSVGLHTYFLIFRKLR